MAYFNEIGAYDLCETMLNDVRLNGRSKKWPILREDAEAWLINIAGFVDAGGGSYDWIDRPEGQGYIRIHLYREAGCIWFVDLGWDKKKAEIEQEAGSTVSIDADAAIDMAFCQMLVTGKSAHIPVTPERMVKCLLDHGFVDAGGGSYDWQNWRDYKNSLGASKWIRVFVYSEYAGIDSRGESLYESWLVDLAPRG